MKTLLAFFVSILLLSAFHVKAQTGVSIPQLAAFDTAMNHLLNDYNVPGGQLAITYHGKLVFNRGFGYADSATQTPVQPNSIFRIASVSKPITAIAIMKLIENGQLQLNDTIFGVNGILNDVQYSNILDPQVLNITLKNLLNHEGGWNRDVSGDPMFDAYNIAIAMGTTPPADAVTVIRYVLANKMLDFPPGSNYNYSNFGYNILGRVIEKITGLSYHDYVTTTILNPLGIYDMDLGRNLLQNKLPNEVNYYYPGNGISCYDNITSVPIPYGNFNVEAMDAHGGWVCSAEDLCRIICAVDKFATRPDILSTSTLNTMTTAGQHSNYACGWAVNTSNNWWHQGSLPGTESEIVRAGNQQLNWAILLNSRPLNSAPLETAIDNLVWNALGSISSWPTIDLFTGINEQSDSDFFSISPNPAKNRFNVQSSRFKVGNELRVFDVVGKEIFSMQISSEEILIDCRNWRDGIYFVQIKTNNSIVTKKIIVAKN